MGFFKKNIDFICVIGLAIWINFFPSTDEIPAQHPLSWKKTSYSYSNVNAPHYNVLRFVVPIIGVIACIVVRKRRNEKDDE